MGIFQHIGRVFRLVRGTSVREAANDENYERDKAIRAEEMARNEWLAKLARNAAAEAARKSEAAGILMVGVRRDITRGHWGQ